MSFETVPSLARLFFDQASAQRDRPFLWNKGDGAWQSRSYDEVAADIRCLALGLIALGVNPGDRVALISENRPEWLIADLAIMSIGAISVPAFATNTAEDNRHVLTHSGAKGLITSNDTIAKRVLPAALQAPELQFIISIDNLNLAQRLSIPVLTWAEVFDRGAPIPATALDQRLDALKRQDVCCFIYTSGTGGVPKGVMLTHGSILCNMQGAYKLVQEIQSGTEIFLSFLPLSHSYEHTAGQFLPISIGGQIYYAESVEKLVDNMAEVRPTIMTAVPRLYEAIHQKILRGLKTAKPTQRRLFDLTLALGRKRYENPRGLTLKERLLDRFCDLTVRRKVRARFGGRLKAFVSGGAALNYEIGIFFLALGVRLLQGYGQTECSPVITCNRPNRIRIDTVGPVFDGLAIKIAEDGEVLVQGEAVMAGYWRDAEATSKAIQDGWLHTGDIGEFDADGNLKITDRKKDIIVLSGGDNVSPARIEGFLLLQPEIAQVMVHGDKHPHVVALVVPDAEFAKEWARQNGNEVTPEQLAVDPQFHKAIGQSIDRVNRGLSAIERVRRFAILPEGFNIDNGMLTPSLKIRRHKIRERWAEEIAQLYEK
ncbi:MAG TPA: long-chain fatty acid--CoA ligase [Terriglobia bacterium]|nr:long-chain fatty acid--CoA ligase [Terriglobia bacterium]